MTPKQAKFGRRVYIYIYKHRPNYGFAIRHLGKGNSLEYPGQEISVEFHYFPRISVELYGNLQKPKELCGKKQRHRNEFISVRKSCGKARKPKELCGKKQRHRNEFISVRKSCGNPAEKRGNLRNSAEKTEA